MNHHRGNSGKVDHVRLDYRQTEPRRYPGIDTMAAFVEDTYGRLRCQMVAGDDHLFATTNSRAIGGAGLFVL